MDVAFEPYFTWMKLWPELDHILLEPDQPLPLLHRTLHITSPTGTGLLYWNWTLKPDPETSLFATGIVPTGPCGQTLSSWIWTNRSVQRDCPTGTGSTGPTGPTGPSNVPSCAPASCWKLVLKSSRRSCGTIAKQIFVEKLWKKKLKVKRSWMRLMRSKQQEQRLPCPMNGFEPRSS